MFEWGIAYESWLNTQDLGPLLLIFGAFLGGLIASISPCILGLLPVNLSYIGTLKITSRKEAFWRSITFILGVVVTLSLLGLIASFAHIIWLSYRGYVSFCVGIFVFLMGLVMSGILSIRLPQLPDFAHRFSSLGTFGVGLTFALVSSPCSSPVLFTVLALATSTSSHLYSVLTMVSYTFGYTLILFIASLFAGFTKQTSGILKYSESITKFSSIILVLVGLYYVYDGLNWVLAISQTSG